MRKALVTRREIGFATVGMRTPRYHVVAARFQTRLD
jgi:hypothetical protein